MFSSLYEGKFAFAIDVQDPGVHLRAAYCSALADSVLDVASVQRDLLAGSAEESGALEQIVASVLTEIVEPASLRTVLSEASDCVERLMQVTLDLLVHKIKECAKDAALVDALGVTLGESSSGMGDSDWHWNPDASHSSFTMSADRRTAARESGRSPDYAGAVGSVAMTSGIHEWTFTFSGRTSRFWVGVATEGMPVGFDSIPESFRPSTASVWWWRDNGCVGKNNPEFELRTTHQMGEGTEYGVRLDVERGILEFFDPPTKTVFHTFDDVQGEGKALIPFIYFDYETTCKLVKTTVQLPAHLQKPPVPSAVSAGLCATLIQRTLTLSEINESALTLCKQCFGCVDTILNFVRHEAAKQAPGWAFAVVQHCQLDKLLEFSIALGKRLVGHRGADGEAFAGRLVSSLVQGGTTLNNHYSPTPNI